MLVGISLIDMADITETDVSNLSKYERGVLQPPLRVVLSYHIITKTPLSKLLFDTLSEISSLATKRMTALIERLESEASTKSLSARISNLSKVFNSVMQYNDE